MRVVLVHGFTQTGRSWDGIAAVLRAGGHDVVAPDLPGHGDRSEDNDCSLRAAAAVLAEEAGDGAAWVGYSLGGRVALTAAIGGVPMRRLVLLGAHPGLENEAARADRRAEDEARAARLERIGLDDFLEEWLAMPMFAGLAESGAAAIDDRRRNTVAGLAASLRQAGTGTQESMWSALPGLSMPMLVTAGERDTKFADIGRRLAAEVGENARFVSVPESGHAAHLENPSAFLELVQPFVEAD